MAEEKAPTKAAAATADEKAADKAAAEQQAKDLARGYRLVEWSPGIMVFQSLLTGHTTAAEPDMVTYHGELSRHGIVTSALAAQ